MLIKAPGQEFETDVVNEPSVFEPLKVYLCPYTSQTEAYMPLYSDKFQMQLVA